MSFTRRGWIVAVAVVAAFLSGVFFGARGLNAVAMPGLLALIVAKIQVRRIPQPILEREMYRKGQRGQTVPVRLHFDVDKPFNAVVEDEIGEGLSATDNRMLTTISDVPVTYDLHLDDRGAQSIGPAKLHVRDVLSLEERTYEYTATQEILVHPAVHALQGPRRQDLVMLYGGPGDDRQQFDQLRLYQRGDPLRDIHWKSSAKQPEDNLVVKQFTADEGTQTIRVVGEATDGHADAMAEAAASIAIHLLDHGVNVVLSTPTGGVSAETAADDDERVLDHLARTRAGRVNERNRRLADVVISSTGDGVEVDIAGRSCSFAELAGSPVDIEEPFEPIEGTPTIEDSETESETETNVDTESSRAEASSS
ncbi:MAG: DUF58 domain-containing protein [Halobacteriales archaeon]